MSPDQYAATHAKTGTRSDHFIIVRTPVGAIRLQFFMSENVVVTIGHRLGKVEAVRRLKEGFARIKGHLGPMIAIEQDAWQGDVLRFNMRAFGQIAAATIEVLEDTLRIEVALPWLLAKMAKRFLPILRKEAALLLENK